MVTRFQIALSKKYLALLEGIKSYFKGVGNIYSKKDKFLIDWHVSSVKDLRIIIDHFDKYPLKTQKLADYLLFKQVFNLILAKQHLTIEGISKIVAIKASINRGLSDELKAAFPDIQPILRPSGSPDNKIIEDINPGWMLGFTEGEGCFNVLVANSSHTKSGFSVGLVFQITQHLKDLELMESFIQFWGCGRISKRSPLTGDPPLRVDLTEL